MLGTGDSKPRSGEGERKSLGGVKESPVPPLLGVNVDRGIFIFKGVKNELLGFSLLLGDSNFKSGEIGLAFSFAFSICASTFCLGEGVFRSVSFFREVRTFTGAKAVLKLGGENPSTLPLLPNLLLSNDGIAELDADMLVGCPPKAGWLRGHVVLNTTILAFLLGLEPS